MSRSVSAPSSVTNTSPCWNGLIVPGSTLMYGSSLRLVTRTPRLARMAASDAAAMPLPSEETTPPVTNTNLVMGDLVPGNSYFTRTPLASRGRAGKCCPMLRVVVGSTRRSYRARLSRSPVQARRHASTHTLAAEHHQDRVDARCVRRAAHQHAQRHHHLPGLQPV